MDVYVQQLVDALHDVVPAWLERCVVQTARRLGFPTTPDLVGAASSMSESVSAQVLADLDRLLATDVDAQSSNPLSVLRRAVVHPTAVLVAHGVPAPRRDDFAMRNFPDDVYGISPAAWTDVDETLQEPGLIWGAWKAKTVLDRRRAEGQLPARGQVE